MSREDIFVILNMSFEDVCLLMIRARSLAVKPAQRSPFKQPPFLCGRLFCYLLVRSAPDLTT